ncbi:acyl-CoA dehydrogenase family protein [Streptomyces sp. MZ04]|uniref:acyl-CoA dehydrogenase family protein n=1 Tax=Streptomyces sp. MZ04 TaxID=2559236 RepID=UPI00107E7A5E|nr:acyl-CoA dehydrogenase family protein [Streptomyces sp. MZ04]TGB15535.1 acyl-CoA dehydrogenase [Streptomyces sp. MZ04]
MSDLFLSREHRELRDEVRQFAEDAVAPRVADMEASRKIERDLAEQIAGRGWIGVTIPTKYGGMGAGHLAKTLILEELSRISAAVGAMTQASQLGVAKILRYGSEEQKQFWLRKVASGACLPTIAVTEDVSGSYVLGMETTAVREGDTYILNGAKVYVGNSHIGDIHGVVARTGDGSRGLTAFLVEADRPGLTVSPHQGTLGLHGFSFGELIFDNCRIPAANRLGVEGDGKDVAYSSSILYGRPNLTAVALGVHRAILETATAFSKERIRYGKPLHELETVKNKLGLIKSRVMTGQITAYHAVSLEDRGMLCDAELMNAKFFNVEAVLDSVRTAMEIYAAAGLYTDRPIERYLRDAYHLRAPGGTSDIQLLRLGQNALGLAKGQYSERPGDQQHAAESTAALPA